MEHEETGASQGGTAGPPLYLGGHLRGGGEIQQAEGQSEGQSLKTGFRAEHGKNKIIVIFKFTIDHPGAPV